MTKIQNSKQLVIGSYLRFGYCNLEFICNLVLVICNFPDKSGFPLCYNRLVRIGLG